jgi:hypothetical protein
MAQGQRSLLVFRLKLLDLCDRQSSCLGDRIFYGDRAKPMPNVADRL